MRIVPIAHVAYVLILAVCLVPPRPAGGEGAVPATQPTTRPLFEIGRLSHGPISESSGLAASRRFTGVFWTHNDSGNPPVLYAVDQTGRLLAEAPVAARNIDWEDIAVADDRIYIADIGNNNAARRTVQVVELSEPDPSNVPAGPLRPTCTWSLTYPDDHRFDSEAFFVIGGHGYLISKQRNLAPAVVCRFVLDRSRPTQQMEQVMTLPIRVPVTAADVSEDGRWLLVLTVAGPRVFEINGDLARAASAEPLAVTYIDPVMEAACLTPDGVLATNERRQVLLFTWEQLRGAPMALPTKDQ